MIKRWFRKIVLAVLVRELKRLDDAEDAVFATREAMAALHLSANSPREAKLGGSWCVLAYEQGGRDIVRFYNFGTRNVGGLRDFLDKFRAAGAKVKVHGDRIKGANSR